MYKLLIAEDEEIFRKVLPAIIDWNSIGFEVAGAVENGFEALKFLERTEVDVILTDIRMPILNGLELAMEVKSRYPGIKTILLSAFNEFEYARKGIDCGVYGYLLKSDEEENIKKYFIKLGKALEQENLIDKCDESLWGYREAFLKNLINVENNDIDIIAEQGKKVNIDIPARKLVISLIRLDEYNSLVQTYGASKIKNIIKFIRAFLVKNVEIKKLGYVVEINDILCVIWDLPEDSFRQNIKTVHGDLSAELSLMEIPGGNELAVTFACSAPADGPSQIGQIYNETLSLFRHNVYLSGNKVLYRDNFQDIKDQAMTFSEEERIIREIQGMLQEGDSQRIIQYFDQFEEELIQKSFTDINQITTLSIKTVLAVSNDIGRMRGNTQEFFAKSSYLIKNISFCETITAVFRQLKIFLVEVIVLLNKENTPLNKRITEEAVKFMQENYAKSINLESVARHVNVHPVHLSRLFSQDFGKTFKNVLTEIRIEEAKKMLMDINNKVYEIAFAVGYENPRYFSELFRSITNLTPVEYREKYKA